MGPVSYLMASPAKGRASQTVFVYIWATDIIIKLYVLDPVQSEPQLHSKRHFIS